MEEIYAKIQDRQGGFVEVRTYRREKDLVLGLFKEGYPDSFDEYDLEFVKEFLEKWEEKDLDHGCLSPRPVGNLLHLCKSEISRKRHRPDIGGCSGRVSQKQSSSSFCH